MNNSSNVTSYSNGSPAAGQRHGDTSSARTPPTGDVLACHVCSTHASSGWLETKVGKATHSAANCHFHTTQVQVPVLSAP